MKLTLKHSNHVPSASLTEWIERQLAELEPSLQIDEARIHLEWRHESSPAFHVSMHLVTPGPDVTAEAADHTLRAALSKAFASVEKKIDQRHEKRQRRKGEAFGVALARRSPVAGARR
jgi:ribosome-associated translation inhibitor RaiA